jgi:hypothetical protein
MPNALEKGPYWSVAEDVLNSDRDTRVSILEMLRSGESLLDTASVAFTLESETLDHGPLNTTEKRVEHGRQDFFGETHDFVWDPKNPTRSIGLWLNYWGDVEGIIRESAIHVIEISLGLEHDEDVARASKFLPIRVLWSCPSAFFAAWPVWDEQSVTWVLKTPSEGGPILKAPANGRECQVADHSGTFGMLQVTHEFHEEFVLDSTEESGLGEWIVAFGPVVKGEGAISVVRPNEIDGGVAPEGRKFEAPVSA